MLNIVSFIFEISVFITFVSIFYTNEFYSLVYHDICINTIYIYIITFFYFIRSSYYILKLNNYDFPNFFKLFLNFITVATIFFNIFIISQVFYIQINKIDELFFLSDLKLIRFWTDSELFQIGMSYSTSNNYQIISENYIKSAAVTAATVEDLKNALDKLYLDLMAKHLSNKPSNFFSRVFDYIEETSISLAKNQPLLKDARFMMILLTPILLVISHLECISYSCLLDRAGSDLPLTLSSVSPDELPTISMMEMNRFLFQIKILFCLLHANDGLYMSNTFPSSMMNIPYKILNFLATYDCVQYKDGPSELLIYNKGENTVAKNRGGEVTKSSVVLNFGYGDIILLGIIHFLLKSYPT